MITTWQRKTKVSFVGALAAIGTLHEKLLVVQQANKVPPGLLELFFSRANSPSFLAFAFCLLSYVNKTAVGCFQARYVSTAMLPITWFP